MTMKEKLAELRKAKGLTQQDLAEALNVSRQAVSRWEVGTAAPSLDNLAFLSRLYGIPMDDLIQEEAEIPAAAPALAPAGPGRRYVTPVCAFLAVLILGVGILIGINLNKEPEQGEPWYEPYPAPTVQDGQTVVGRVPTDLQKELEKALDAFVEKGTRVEPLSQEELEGLQFQDSYAYLVIPGDAPGEEKYERCIITSDGEIIEEGVIVEEINEEHFIPIVSIPIIEEDN